jgi:acyl-CoA synthetase (AMP-forming)/AMP-acid ligase II
LTECFGPLDSSADGKFVSGCVGSVSALTEIKIIDLNTGKSLGPNLDGEICLRGPQLFVGYLNNESATKSAIDSKGWFHSGDVGYYDEKERFFITDRLKELIKFKAWSIAPVEIESLLLTHESVDSVAVVGVKHKTDGQLPRAFIKVKNGSKVTEEELIKFVEGLNCETSFTLFYTKLVLIKFIFLQITWLSKIKFELEFDLLMKFRELLLEKLIENSLEI